MRICLVYDCLFPHTVGGAERWYRNLGERLATDGHEVTYLTMRQWDRGGAPDVPGVDVRAVGPRMRLYARRGQRRILPPIVFGLGVLWYLLRHGHRYDIVHTASFPYFSLIAAGLIMPVHRFRLVVDWHEVWSRRYWHEYLGWWAGECGWLVQCACARIPQRAFCFSRLQATRLTTAGLRGETTVLRGEYDGPAEVAATGAPAPLVVFAGRHIPDKQVPAIPPALLRARRQLPALRGLIIGDGPERSRVVGDVEQLGLSDAIELPGFVDPGAVDAALASATCLLLPSRREGYGMVVVEAARHGTPSIVVAAEDNAAVELIEEGVNGTVARSADAAELATAIVRVDRAGESLRRSTAAWYRRNAAQLSLTHSVEQVLQSYAASGIGDHNRR
jgi:glycosyltransferase involved in cell wall biosynthesis